MAGNEPMFKQAQPNRQVGYFRCILRDSQYCEWICWYFGTRLTVTFSTVEQMDTASKFRESHIDGVRRHLS